MLPVYERVFKFEHKELWGIFFIITRSSHCIKAANILNCNIKTRTEVPKTASLELEVYYESFKNFAKLQSQLFNTVIWTRHKEGNAEGLETKHSPHNSPTLHLKEKNSSCRFFRLFTKFHCMLQKPLDIIKSIFNWLFGIPHGISTDYI